MSDPLEVRRAQHALAIRVAEDKIKDLQVSDLYYDIGEHWRQIGIIDGIEEWVRREDR